MKFLFFNILLTILFPDSIDVVKINVPKYLCLYALHACVHVYCVCVYGVHTCREGACMCIRCWGSEFFILSISHSPETRSFGTLESSLNCKQAWTIMSLSLTELGLLSHGCDFLHGIWDPNSGAHAYTAKHSHPLSYVTNPQNIFNQEVWEITHHAFPDCTLYI